MYTTIIHPIRKAFNLSLHEYCVLDSVYLLSHNNKFGNWCIMSKKNIAEELDLSERTVFVILKTLIKKELIERSEKGYVRTTDMWNEVIANKHDWYIAFNGKESQFVSGKPQPLNETALENQHTADTTQKLHTHYAETAESPMQKLQTIITGDNNKIIIPPTPTGELKEIIDFYEKEFSTKLISLSASRKNKIKARLAVFTLDQIKQAITFYANSPFHQGKNDRGWKANFDFIVRDDEHIENAIVQTQPSKIEQRQKF